MTITNLPEIRVFLGTRKKHIEEKYTDEFYKKERKIKTSRQ